MRRTVVLEHGLRLSVIVHAPADSRRARRSVPTFVLVHGLASNARMWDGVGQALASAGHRAVAVDLRGHGHSDKPRDGYDMGTVAADIRALLPRIDERPVVLAGQSWGGNVVFEAASRSPDDVRAVCGVDGGAIRLVDAYPEWERCAMELAPPLLTGTPVEDIEQWLREAHPDWSDAAIEGAMANFEVRADRSVTPWLSRERHLRILRSLWAHDPRPLYPRLTMPSLLIAAGGGETGRRAHLRQHWFEEAADLLPAGEVVWLPDADHDVHAQQPNRTAELLLRLAARAPGTSSVPSASST